MKVGVVGLGFMGATHVRAYVRCPGATLAAVCSSDPRKLAGDLSAVHGNLARENGPVDLSDAAKYTDWRQLILDPELDAVDICLPTDLHAGVAIAALRAGKHVLIEKPMALKPEECAAIEAAASGEHTVLMVAHVLRFWPEYLGLCDYVESHSKSALRAVTFERRCGVPTKTWLQESVRSGGALLDLLIHDFDQAIRLFGIPQSVMAQPAEGVDAVNATLFYDEGPTVYINGGWYEEGRPFSMNFHADSDVSTLALNTEGVLTCSSHDGSSLVIETNGSDAFQAEIDYFVECCCEGKEPEKCRPSESASAVRLASLLNTSRSLGGVQLQCTP